MPATLTFDVSVSNGRVGKLAKPPAREAGACGFDSHLGYLCAFVQICAVFASPGPMAKASGLHPEDGGSIPSGMTVGVKVRNGLLVQWEDAWLATRRPGFDSPAVHSVLDGR